MSNFPNRRRGFLPLLAAVALALSTLAPTGARSEPPGPQTIPPKRPVNPDAAKGLPFTRMTLPNGLEVIAVENHGTPLVTIDITVRNGAFTEPNEFAGLSHLYEHMFFKANRSLPSQTEFMKRIRNLGISFNGYTSEEVVTYFFTLPSKNLDPGMRFMADAIRSPLFDSTELVREREVVLGEFDRNEAQPDFVLGYALDSALWNPYVSRKQALGQRQVIKTATVEKMRMIQKRFYVPNNSALIISGDLDPKVVMELATKYFADWQRGSAPFPTYNPPAFPTLASKLVVREASIPYVDASLNFHGPSVGADEPAPYQAELLTTMINQPGSRLKRRLIDSGLASEFQVSYDNARNTGLIRFAANTDGQNARRVLDIIKQELRAMGSPGYFSDDEIAIGKKIIADRPLFDRDNPFYFAIGTLARWWSSASLDYYTAIPTNVRKVTRDDLASFVNRYLVSRPFVAGIGSDRKTLDQAHITEEVLKW